MAYKDSDELKTDERYPLGDYSFRIERISVPGSTNDKIEAICTDKDGKNARKSIQIPSSTELLGWYVEANDTTADVYEIIRVPKGGSEFSSPLDTSPIEQPVKTGGQISAIYHPNQYSEYNMSVAFGGTQIVTSASVGSSSYSVLFASPNPNDIGKEVRIIVKPDGSTQVTDYEYVLRNSFTYNGKTVYYSKLLAGLGDYDITTGGVYPAGYLVGNEANVAWTIVYGTAINPEYEEKTMLVGRFAIDLEDAGGVGPGSGWTDPGDYDPDWEEGDPTHTLYVTVTGALSGRHNDPIVDPSYSYIPSDKNTVKDYGCGGDGGHGGGGGAGASTVVVYKFATNQANSKEVTAIARRHGYGSGGGKGGKGGDGCILVYY